MFKSGILLKLIVFSVYFISSSSSNPLSPDKKQFFHGITSGKGLYSQFDKIALLNVSNFNETVFDEANPRAWVIEFYNSWCGHCHRFARVWKALALDVEGWKDVIRLGAVDCSNEVNQGICRNYEIMSYPTIRFFPIGSTKEYLGESMKQDTAENMRHNIVSQFISSSQRKNIVKPNISPYTSDTLQNLWQGVPQSVLFSVLIVDKEVSVFGTELALDLATINVVQSWQILNSNTDLVNILNSESYPSVFIIDRTLTVFPLNISENNLKRSTAYKTVVDFLVKRGLAINDISVEDHPLKDDDVFNMEQILYFMKIEGMIKEKLKLNDSSDVVFQLDIESAMRYSLVHEISSRKFITGDAMLALKNYLYVLSKHFPISKNGVKFLKGVYGSISSKSEITGSEFESIVLAREKEYDPVFLKPQGWLGCRGSQPQFRGYPCGLWTMFHTLTVHSEANSHRNISTDPQEVLLAIVGYVKNFFGCSHCAKHFLQMSTTMRGNVSSFDDSILWLWKAHNSANKRLAGDETEDPVHPKVQFPTDKMCPNCTYQNGSYNEQAVLEFLKGMYHNISFMLLTDLPSTPKPSPTPASSDLNEMSSYNKLVYHQDMSVKEKDYVFSKNISPGSGFNFNIFDVSLCVILYICSTGIILLVCVKIFIKRTYRKKPYAYDIFHKV